MTRYDDTRELRRQQIERCFASSLSIKQWCKLNQVSESTFYRWLRTFRKEEPQSFSRSNTEWVQISKEAVLGQRALATVDHNKTDIEVKHPIDDSGPSKGQAEIMVYACGVSIAITNSASIDLIARVLKAVSLL